MTLSELLKAGRERLLPVSGDDAAFEARQLLLHILGTDETGFLLRMNETAAAPLHSLYNELLEKREANIPLQYILGTWDFYGNSFSVGPGVLIPRPETEDLVSLCLERLSEKPGTVIDLCAGSGCIGITIALHREQANVYCVEKYDEAFSFLRDNIDMLCPDRVTPVLGDLTDEALAASFPAADMIVSNPPYIPSAQILSLSEEVQKEPRTALDGGTDGLCFYRQIAKLWLPKLKPGGWCIVECAEDQTPMVGTLFSAFGAIESFSDIYKKERFVALRRSMED